MKILILGRGQMAQAYHDHFIGTVQYRAQNMEQHTGFESQIAEKVDICKKDELVSAVQAYKPDVVLNAAGKTNLDWCEINRNECFSVNTLGADLVGEVCQEHKIYLVHLSSGCLQYSRTPDEVYKEDDAALPISFYSWTKLWAEQMLLAREKYYGLKVLILRGRQLVSASASPRNALTKLLTYSKFIDVPQSMTVIEDMVDATAQLLLQDATGVFNVVNPGFISPYGVALLLREIIKPDMKPEKISKEQLNAMTYAKRVDTLLDGSKLAGRGIVLKEVNARLREIIPQLKVNLFGAEDVLRRTEKETVEKLSLVKNSPSK